MGEVEDLVLELLQDRVPTYSYLELPLGAAHKSVVAWDGVEERYRKCLTLWKRDYLSRGGRLTLIRSSLSSILIYFMSLFLMPNVVKKMLERIQRYFL